MIRWTAAGAVSSPDALQIRVAPQFSGRVAVGAPRPARAMTASEVHNNVLHYTRSTPRTQPIHTLVLSGLGHEPVASLVQQWRDAGVDRLVLHTSPSTKAEPELVAAADQVVTSIATVEEATQLAPSSSVVVVCSHEIVAALPQIVSALCDAKEVVWVWPFPVPGVLPPPAAPAVAQALMASGALDDRTRVKGLPPCVLPMSQAAKTRNRYYVDADHQMENAMVFFPDLVRFAKPDSCRFCKEDVRCDGVAETWWRAGLVGPMRPL